MVNFLENATDFISSWIATLICERFVRNLMLVYDTQSFLPEFFQIFLSLSFREKKKVNFMENVIDFLTSWITLLIFQRFVSNLKSWFMVPWHFSQNFFRFFCLLVSEKKMVNFLENVMDFLSSKIAPLISEWFVWNLKSYFMVPTPFSQNFFTFYCLFVYKKKWLILRKMWWIFFHRRLLC